MGTLTPLAANRPLGRVVALDTGQTDAELIANALLGSKFAKEQLFRRYVHRVGGRAFRLLGNDEDLEDIVQDTFVAAFSSLATLRQLDSFAGWLDAVATRTAIAVLRRRRFLRRLGLGRSAHVDLDLLIGNSVPQELAVELKALYAVIDSLPSSERVVLTLRRVEQLELTEIAAQTGLSLSTVKRRLANAERLIGELLEPSREES